MKEQNSSQGIALVTGAAKRIGRAIAYGLAKAGWDVAIHYHRSTADAESLQKEIRALGHRAITLQADLAQVAEVEGMMQRCVEQLGAPTCLVNNASVFRFDEIGSVSSPDWDAMQATNLRAPIILARDFAKHLPTNAEGNIINLLDQKIANLNPDFFSYTIGKAGSRGRDPHDGHVIGPTHSRQRRRAGIDLGKRRSDPRQFRRRTSHDTARARG